MYSLALYFLSFAIVWAFLSLISWKATGRDPLYWLILALMAIRAIYFTLGAALIKAMQYFLQHLPQEFRDCRLLMVSRSEIV